MSKTLPDSATHGGVALAGFVAFVACVGIVHAYPEAFTSVQAALFLIGGLALALYISDTFFQKVYLRESTGLDFSRREFSAKRTAFKLAGLMGSFSFIALLYWLFPEYHGTFYHRYYTMLMIVLPLWAIAAIPYMAWIDGKMHSPCDGYWQMGRFITLQWDGINAHVLKQHLISWLIKGYFLPLMFIPMCNDIDRLRHFTFDSQGNFKYYFDACYDFIYFTDVSFVSMGYLLSLRISDTHIRSAEPTIYGWVVALICYQPFWSTIGKQYLSYETNYSWGTWLFDTPLFYDVWGIAIVSLLVVYTWATIAFGGRFSNLTHRGVITNGPYRYSKHPAYIAKNLSWWLISVPFLMQDSWSEGVRHCILLLGLNGIYTLRAKTEELHLSRFSDYVAYAEAMETVGIFRFMKNIPLLRVLVVPMRPRKNTA